MASRFGENTVILDHGTGALVPAATQPDESEAETVRSDEERPMMLGRNISPAGIGLVVTLAGIIWAAAPIANDAHDAHARVVALEGVAAGPRLSVLESNQSEIRAEQRRATDIINSVNAQLAGINERLKMLVERGEDGPISPPQYRRR